jgi:hypothetical protein
MTSLMEMTGSSELQGLPAPRSRLLRDGRQVVAGDVFALV